VAPIRIPAQYKNSQFDGKYGDFFFAAGVLQVFDRYFGASQTRNLSEICAVSTYIYDKNIFFYFKSAILFIYFRRWDSNPIPCTQRS
jgi:hypothetical protein